MYRYHNLLVYCSLDPEVDRAVVRFAHRVAMLARSQHVRFCHFTEKPDVSAELATRYPWLAEPVDDQARERLVETLSAHFTADIPSDIAVGEGATLMGLLNHARHQDIDLIICGAESDTRRLGARLARKAPCSVAIVPRGDWADFRHVVAGVDFSEHSRDALDVSVAFATAQGLGSVTGLHVVEDPPGTRPPNVPAERLRELSAERAGLQMNAMLEAYDSGSVVIDPVLGLCESVPAEMARVVREEGADLLVIGCRGRDAMGTLLLGSTAEEIIENATVPVIVVKKKGVGAGFLDALLRS